MISSQRKQEPPIGGSCICEDILELSSGKALILEPLMVSFIHDIKMGESKTESSRTQA